MRGFDQAVQPHCTLATNPISRLADGFTGSTQAQIWIAVYLRERHFETGLASRSTTPQPLASATRQLQPDVTGLVAWAGRRRNSLFAADSLGRAWPPSWHGLA